MTNPDYTHIAAVVDRSGSMSVVKDDMIGGLNAFFEDQAQLTGKCLVDYIQFDTKFERVFADVRVGAARAVLEPRGGTALLDAVARTIVELGEKLDAMPEADRPGKVLVIIVTDGFENSSREWTYASVKELVDKQTNEFSWDFVFLGANIDAVQVGGMFGVHADKAMTFDVTKTGQTMSALSSYTTSYRSSGAAKFTDKDRSEAL